MSKGNAILGPKYLQISGSSQQGSVQPGKPEKGPGEPVPGKRGHVSLLVSEEGIFGFMQGSQPMGKGEFSCLACDVSDTAHLIQCGDATAGPTSRGR